MSEKLYSYDHMDAAVCLWEEIVAPTLNLEPWKDYAEKWGRAGLRDCVMTSLAWPCHEAWERALTRHGVEYAKWEEALKNYESGSSKVKPPAPPEDPGSFDFDFCPFWITQCVDWSGEHPKVKGGTS